MRGDPGRYDSRQRHVSLDFKAMRELVAALEFWIYVSFYPYPVSANL